MSSHPTTVPRLAPPGAGIPAVERLVGGALFALRRWRGSPAQFTAQFTREREAICSLYRAATDDELSVRKLIPRLRGLEDSSRFWSVWMTLDHLRIVNVQIAQVIDGLLHGRVPEGEASTAAVKPGANVDASVVTAYESSCDQLLSIVAVRENLRTPLRYAHPWFGPLDAAGWHAMAATHMGIHRAQIARILSEVKRSPK